MPRKNNKGRKPINYKKVNTLRLFRTLNNNFYGSKQESNEYFKKATKENREQFPVFKMYMIFWLF